MVSKTVYISFSEGAVYFILQSSFYRLFLASIALCATFCVLGQLFSNVSHKNCFNEYGHIKAST